MSKTSTNNGATDKSNSILIIEDNPINLGVAVDYLEASGFLVLVAQDGESGLKRAKYTCPHLILLDVILPGINGFETCRGLKADAATKDIPVIFMTALSDIEDKVKGFEVGAVDYITKPIQREELIARITTHLRLQALTQQLQKQNQQLQQQASALIAAKEATESAYSELQRLNNLDGLTQIPNRRRFEEHLSQEWRRTMREKVPLSLILGDIDYFKRYNDYYGHPAGDACLRQVAQALYKVVKRPADLVARYGGEEFVITLPNTTAAGAVQVAELILLEIQLLRIPHAQSDVSANVTMSLGVSSQVPSQESQVEFLIAAADRALYAAKRRGRNTHSLCLVDTF